MPQKNSIYNVQPYDRNGRRLTKDEYTTKLINKANRVGMGWLGLTYVSTMLDKHGY